MCMIKCQSNYVAVRASPFSVKVPLSRLSSKTAVEWLCISQFTSVVDQVTTLSNVSPQTFSTVYAIFRAALNPKKFTLLLAVCM